MTIDPLTLPEFSELAAKDSYWKGRWDYMWLVIDMAKRENPRSILEIGPWSRPLFRGPGCCTMGMDQAAKMLPKELTYWHDATKPWPVSDKRFDLCVATQVWEHLKGGQQAAWAQVRRCCRAAILSLPYRWNCPSDPIHHMVTDGQIAEWTQHCEPVDALVLPGPPQRWIGLWRFAE